LEADSISTEKTAPCELIMGITCYLAFISQYISAIETLQYDRPELLSNAYIELANQAIERQLTMDICKIYDRENYRDNINCSMEALRGACLACPESFPKEEKDELICEISSLYVRFEEIISRNTRNKKLAHGDLEELFSINAVYIEFEKEKELFLRTVETLEKVAHRLHMKDWKISDFLKGPDINKDYLGALDKLYH